MAQYIDRRTKKFKSLEENVRKLFKKELDLTVTRIAKIEDVSFDYDNEHMLCMLVKFYQKFNGFEFRTVECGCDVYVSKHLFNTVQDWTGIVLHNEDFDIIDLDIGQNLLNSL